MATLQAQIVTELAVVIASANMIDLSNQRDTDVAEDTTRTAKVAELAAAKVKSYLGDVDSTDVQAVDIGLRIALLYYSNNYSLIQGQAGRDALQSIYAELDELRQSRLSEIEPQLGSPDLTNLDALYPTETEWDDPDEDD